MVAQAQASIEESRRFLSEAEQPLKPTLGHPLVDNLSHTKLVIEELLPRARKFVEDSERRLAAQEARVADLERKGRDLPQSRKLLSIMRETMTLQISHVKLLEREVRLEEEVHQR